MKTILSMDFGGTWIRAAKVSPDGAAGSILRRPTERHRPAGRICDDLIDMIDQVGVKMCGGVAVGIPTILDEKGGLSPCENLPTMGGINLAERLRERLKVPVRLFNDADCFTVGEWWMGAGKAAKNLCGVTLGTGLGLGLIINGSLYTGSHGCAGEVWKAPYGTGLLEDEACGKAIVRNYESVSGVRLDGEKIAELAEQGDSRAVEVFRKFGESLGRVISLVVNLLDPEVVVLGGSVARSFPLFQGTLRETVLTGTVSGEQVRIVESILGEQAALLGSAKLYWNGNEDRKNN